MPHSPGPFCAASHTVLTAPQATRCPHAPGGPRPCHAWPGRRCTSGQPLHPAALRPWHSLWPSRVLSCHSRVLVRASAPRAAFPAPRAAGACSTAHSGASRQVQASPPTAACVSPASASDRPPACLTAHDRPHLVASLPPPQPPPRRTVSRRACPTVFRGPCAHPRSVHLASSPAPPARPPLRSVPTRCVARDGLGGMPCFPIVQQCRT